MPSRAACSPTAVPASESLGRVVEVLRGTTYNQALRRYLTDPLGVDEVVVDVGEAPAYRTAIGHVSAGPGAPLRPLRTWAVMPASNPAAGNQLAMPARGLTRFAQMHLADGLAPDGTRLLSAESRASCANRRSTSGRGRTAPASKGWDGG